MNIHEYQAKILLGQFGVPVPVGYPAFSVEEAVDAGKKLKDSGNEVFVVKAQIHAGGRGKAGGVKVVKTLEDLEKSAKNILGKTLITPQTDAKGQQVGRLYVEAGSAIKKEYYISAVLDRALSTIVFIASSEGGVEIEEVAEKTPEKITRVAIGIAEGVQGYHVRRLGFGIGLESANMKQFNKIISGIYEMFLAKDAFQIEVNPMVMTEEGDLIALDAKVNFDDNALYRHSDVVELRDLSEEEESEIEASNNELSYVKMSGNVGCMVNGAGLAMSTMDIIKLHGHEPANFLDVGGSATCERVTKAFQIILSDSSVKAILVNIFGGIMRCDIIAEGIIEAAKGMKIDIPLIVRLEGTNVELGKKMLSESELSIITADDLEDAAQKVNDSLK